MKKRDKSRDRDNVSKSVTTSSSDSSMRIHRNLPKNEKSRKAKSSSLSTMRAKSLHDLDTYSVSSSSIGNKVCLGGKTINDDVSPTSNDQELSPRRMYESLIRLRKNPVQPFTFLNDILDDEPVKDCVPVHKNGPTEIEMQLAALTRRVRLNKSLLERTNERVKEINSLVKRNVMAASTELNYGDSDLAVTPGDNVPDDESALNIACPGIMELKRTINVTKEMLTYVKKVCNSEIEMKDLPEELTLHMGVK